MGSTQHPVRRAPVFFFLGVKRPVFQVDRPPLSSAEVKNEWSYTSTPPYIFMASTGTFPTLLSLLVLLSLYRVFQKDLNDLNLVYFTY